MTKNQKSLLVFTISVFIFLIWTILWLFWFQDKAKKNDETLSYGGRVWWTQKDHAFLVGMEKGQPVLILLAPETCPDCETKIQSSNNPYWDQFTLCKIPYGSSDWENLLLDDRLQIPENSNEPLFFFFLPSEDFLHSSVGIPEPKDWKKILALSQSTSEGTSLEEP